MIRPAQAFGLRKRPRNHDAFISIREGDRHVKDDATHRGFDAPADFDQAGHDGPSLRPAV